MRLKLFLDHAYETDWARAQWSSVSQTWSTNGPSLCDNPAEADAVLVTLSDPRDDYARSVRDISISERYAGARHKVYVFDASDNPLGLHKGIYASLRSFLYSPSKHRTGGYLRSFNEYIRSDGDLAENELRYLFSFQGNFTSSVRARIFSAGFDQDSLVELTRTAWQQLRSADTEAFKRRYADTLIQSRFVLCPRGVGMSSFRLFETLQSARVPVILADDWVPCEGLDWSAFSLRVREKDVSRLPEICREAEPRWRSMALEARKTWETWFSPQGLGRLIETNLTAIARERQPFLERTGLDQPMRVSLGFAGKRLVRGAGLGANRGSRRPQAVQRAALIRSAVQQTAQVIGQPQR